MGQWTSVPSVSHSSLRRLFVLFFRKRLTIQEALSHPWITVRLNKEKYFCFFHEQGRDHILTLTGVLNGKLPSKYFVMLDDSKRCTGKNPWISANDVLYYHNFQKESNKALCLLHITVSHIGLSFAFFHSSLFAWAYTVSWL